MRKAIPLFLGLLILGMLSTQSFAQSNAGFAKLKSLVGEWDWKTESGEKGHTSYRLVSNGTVLMETLNAPDESQMITMYHPDGDRLMVTHYCSANNQPRMRAVPSPANAQEIAFDYVDATNLSSPTAGHMAKLAFQFQDNDHFTQSWTWREGGKDITKVFHYTRVK